MSKQRVEVRLGSEMEDGGVVGVIDVGEYAEELTVDVSDGCREGWMECLA